MLSRAIFTMPCAYAKRDDPRLPIIYILIIPMCSPSVSSIVPYTPISPTVLAISLLALPLSCVVRLVEFLAIASGPWIRVIQACTTL